jgi:hypothetical protein
VKSSPATVCTIIAWNYLAQARVLAASLLETNPDARLVVLVVDQGPSPAVGHEELFETLTVDELGIEGFEAMTFRYTLVELTTSVKPFLLEFLLRTRDLPHLIYLDPDILVMSKLDGVLACFREAVVLLTPHLLTPIEESGTPSEEGILLSGCFNLGFIGVRADPEAYRMLAWWQSRLRTRCLIDTAKGHFVDQRWVDLVPCYFAGVRVIRNAGWNVAYWNIGEREVACQDGVWRVGSVPLVFFHFSGFQIDSPDRISRHQDRHDLTRFPELTPLFKSYAERLRAVGWQEWSARRIPFDVFDNGVEVALVMRRIWQECGGEKRWPHPFDTRCVDGFYHWMMALVPGSSGRPGNLSRLALEIHRRRPDLQRLFPDPCGSDNRAFRLWFVTDGAFNHRISRELSGAPVSVPVRLVVSILGQLRKRIPATTYLRGRRVVIRIWNGCRRWRS